MIAIEHINRVSFKTLSRDYKMGVVVVAGPTPNTTNGFIERISSSFDVLYITIEFETFEICTHDHVDHTSHRISAVESRAAIRENFDAIGHNNRDCIDVYEFTTALGNRRIRRNTPAVD